MSERDSVKRAIRLHRAVEDSLDECERQVDEFGVQRHHPAYWLAIMGKQVGQFGSAILNREWAAINAQGRSQSQLRTEAVQMAAVALSIIECIDSGEMPTGLVTSKPSNPRQLARALNRGDESLNYDGIGEPGSEPCS